MTEARRDRLTAANVVPVRDAERPELRACDEDRDRTAAQLGGALAVGRLTSTEYAERLDAAYAARTIGELAPLTRDLPEADSVAAGVEPAGRAELIIIVPAGAHVIDEGGALFAKRAVYGHDAAEDAEGPVIRLIGDARFPKVAVHRGAFDSMAPWRHWQDLRHAR
jgi:hypothetical protein